MKSYNNLHGETRREFLKQSSTALAGAALVGSIPTGVHAGENNTIKVALVGCGGRGTGAAANALSTSGPVKLWAMGDVFANRLEASHKNLSTQFPQQIEVPPERRFAGFDAYRKVIDSLDRGDVVLLTTPPAFRPMHFEYAVQKGVHVFMEKSFAVDAPGIRRVLKAGERAKEKNLRVATGLMSRHYQPLEEAVARIHQGAIGEVITAWAYRMHGPVGVNARTPEMTELAYQIANYSCFTWLNGSFIVDWLIHNLDVCCWVKDGWPVSAQGMGGRQVRNDPDQLFDHYSAEYTFADGTRLLAQGRHMNKCWDFFGDVIHGAQGLAVLGEGIPNPRIYKGHQPKSEHLIWQYRGRPCNHYQVEHDLFFDAIRCNKPYNEVQRSAYACLVGIMGRMAVESGELITWDAALASEIELAPGLERYNYDSKPPVQPGPEGRYPIAMPGQARLS